ncbi:MAG: hypothetical protein HYR94_27945 [Chloroflexi bacterium]|nr:hypothetical protein [Chloroflexota bacterium]
MDYHIVLSPVLQLSADEVAAAWNEVPRCRQVAQAKRAETPPTQAFPLDPALLQHGLVFLAGVAGAITLDVLKELLKEQLSRLLKKKLTGRPQPQVVVEAIRQPDGAYLLVVKEAEEEP